MKKANYELKEKRSFGNSEKYYATVTLTDEGKTNISILNRNYNSSSTNYRLKSLGEQIVKADFIHEAISGEVYVENNQGLISRLTAETQILKKMFIYKTKQYAVRSFIYAKPISKMTYPELCKKFGTTQEKMPYKAWHLDKDLLYVYGYEIVTKLTKWGKKTYEESQSIVLKGLKKHVSLEVLYAEDHYKRSINKLASRLFKMGVKDSDELTIKTSKIGVNIETILIHKELGEIRAWTIIAEGPIQRPHYRYLIK